MGGVQRSFLRALGRCFAFASATRVRRAAPLSIAVWRKPERTDANQREPAEQMHRYPNPKYAEPADPHCEHR